MNKVYKAIIPVAGLGTRVLPASKAIPKEMLPVVDKPVIQHVIEEAVTAGITEIVLVTRTGKSSIEDHFDTSYELEAELERKGKVNILASVRDILPSSVRISTVRQPQALGLGHAIQCASNLIGDSAFAVLLPDVLVNTPPGQTSDLSTMIEKFEASRSSQIMVESVPNDKVHMYGIANCDGNSPPPGSSTHISQLVEKPEINKAPSNFAVVGRYILPSTIMSLLTDTKPGAGGEIQLTDALDQLINEQPVSAYRMRGKTYDCGNKLGYLEANLIYGLQHPETASGLKEILKSLGN